MATKQLDYRDGAVTCKGVLAYDDKQSGARPGVVLFPEAFGIGEHVINCAKRLASLGYVALAADPYGDGATATDLPSAIAMMTAVRGDYIKWRARAKAALDALAAQPNVDRGKLAATGYCFGGSTALELGRAGVPLGAIVSFHGGLECPKPEDSANIKAKVLVCTGADDPLIPTTQVAAFEEQMRKTKVDWQVQVYGGTVHSFTNPDAGKLGNPALGYNAAADQRSWKAMLDLFGEAFGKA
jgi:dienelactone hydrolase